jgi:hypothetical protein
MVLLEREKMEKRTEQKEDNTRNGGNNIVAIE